MFPQARVLRAEAIAVGVALGAIGVVAAPETALTGVGVGVVARPGPLGRRPGR